MSIAAVRLSLVQRKRFPSRKKCDIALKINPVRVGFLKNASRRAGRDLNRKHVELVLDSAQSDCIHASAYLSACLKQLKRNFVTSGWGPTGNFEVPARWASCSERFLRFDREEEGCDQWKLRLQQQAGLIHSFRGRRRGQLGGRLVLYLNAGGTVAFSL
jgi:hypothetical protein